MMSGQMKTPFAAAVARRFSMRVSTTVITVMAFMAGACQSGTTPVTSAAEPAPHAAPISTDRARLVLEPVAGRSVVVGSRIAASADGLPPNRAVEIVWETVTGEWLVENYFRFKGKKYSETTIVVGTATTNADGRLATQFVVPEDFGGVHNVLVRVDDRPVAQGGLEVMPEFSLVPAEGPVGTPVEVRVTGLGWRTMDSTYVVSWDNAEVGWVSAVSTKGTAVARFRASGAAGDHPVKLYTGWTGHSYLNYTQAPNAYLPRPEFLFHVTAGGAPATAFVEPYAPQPVPAADAALRGRATMTPSQGVVATPVELSASGLPANAQVQLVWGTQAGSRVTESGFGEREDDLGAATVDANGTLKKSITIPDDLGGLHALSIRSGTDTLAVAHFTIETSIVGLTPTSGPPGTPITVHLKGVGWTDYDNIYVATYDNAYMGYACGFNSQGDVTLTFAAAGAPGVHLVDFYPGIYQGPENGQQVYRLPQLTYALDHPGNRIPALRFAFTVTPSPATRRPTN